MSRKRFMLCFAALLLGCLMIAAPAFAIKVYVNPSNQSNNVSPDGSYNEGYSMQDVASRLMTKLTNRGFSARNSGWLSLSGACNDAVTWDADSFVALHTNASGGGGWSSAHGTDGFYYQSSGGWHDPVDVDLCNRCVTKCVSKFSAFGRGQNNGIHADWPYYGYNLYVLANTPGMNSVLIEGLFHTNYDDTQVLKSDSGKDAYAQAIFEAVCDFYGWNYGQEIWDSAWNAQSYTGTMTPGQQAIVWVEYRNTGNTTWNIGGSYPVHLGTSHPQDRASAFFTSGNWINAARPTEMDSATCAPNEIERFTFIMTAPAQTGYYQEYWRLVAENKTWFGYDGTWFGVTVNNPKGAISGKISDAASGVGIGGATVSLNTGASTTTDGSGNYSFTNLDPATYTVSASAANYDGNSASSTVTAGNTTTTNIALTHQVGNLVGIITDSSTGTAVAGATCQLTGGGSVTSDANGYYAFTSLNSGVTYTVTASKAGYVTKASSKLVSAGIDNWNSIALQPDRGNISGTITNSVTGAAIAGATVSLNTGPSTTSDAGGNYSFADLPSGSYTVSASAANYHDNSATCSVAAGATTTTNLSLAPTLGAISGQVVSASGPAISGATVTLDTGASTTTDAGGNYSFAGVLEGSRTVTASAAGFQANSANVTVNGGYTASCNLTLTPNPGAIAGKISDSGGAGISGATVSITGLSATTDANGDYTLSNVPVGTYTVTASKSGFTTNTGSAVVTSDTTTTCNITLQGDQGTITGQVTETGYGPVSGATVSTDTGQSTTTDGSGNYTLTGVPSGSRTVTASATYFNSNSSTVTVTGGQSTTCNIALTRQTGNLVGLIKNNVTGTILVGANATIAGIGTVQTNTAGKYTFTGLRAGITYTVTGSMSGYLNNSKDRLVSAGVDNWNSFNLDPQAIVSGQVTSSAGGAVSGATVTLSNGSTATTDANGNYSIGMLAAGTYTMTVTHSLHLDWSGSVTTTAGATTTQNVTMTKVADVIVDNNDTAFSVTGAWSTGTSAGYWGTNYRYKSTSTADDRATWSLGLPKAGSYAVYAWWVAGSNRYNAAKFYVNYSGGSQQVIKDQTINGASWQYLGTFNFETSGNSVQLSCNGTSGKVVIADAVKLVKQ